MKYLMFIVFILFLVFVELLKIYIVLRVEYKNVIWVINCIRLGIDDV